MKVVAAFLTAAALYGAAPDCSPVPGWQQHGPARTFVGDTLYEYMNGNSEGYLIYGFRSMKGVTCKSGDNTFVIDISEFSDADGAFGIFTANQDPQKKVEPIGTAGQITPRRAVFVKDRYYLEIAADPDRDHTPALRAFAAALETRIPGATSLPAGLSWFPAEQQTSIRLVPESVLGMRVLKRGYVAEYAYGKAFVVTESTSDAAAAVLEKVRARFAGAAPAELADAAFQVNDKYLGRMLLFRKGRYVGGWAGVKEPHDPAKLAAALAAKLP
jgi:hypothetical protein